MVAPAWRDALAGASIVLSAGTYLFDFGSNVVVLAEYLARYLRSSRHHQKHQSSQFATYFYGLLAILVCCHSLNAVLFKLMFTHKEAPLFAAYFLPFIHLYRLFHLLTLSFSCQGIHDLQSPKMNGLFCILGSAMEGIPILILQFCAYLVLTRDGVLVHSMSTTFKVSVAASLVSAAYNGGTSVQSIAKNATTLKQTLGAGAIGTSFTLCATLVRCLTFTYIIVYIQYILRLKTPQEQGKFRVSDYICILVTAGSIVAYSLYFWLLHSPKNFSKSLRNPHRLLTALPFSYMSIFLGPLYPLLSQANDANQVGSYIFRLKFIALSLLHLLLDLAVFSVTNMLSTLPKPYIIVSSLAIVGYMVSVIAYIKFDASCGPTTSSNVSILPAAHGDDDVNEHKLIPLSELCMLTNAQRQKIEKSEVNEVSKHVNPSSQNTNLARSEKAEETMGCPYIAAHPHDVDLLEAKGCRRLLSSSLSLDRWSMATRSSRNRALIRAYSERKETREPATFKTGTAYKGK